MSENLSKSQKIAAWGATGNLSWVYNDELGVHVPPTPHPLEVSDEASGEYYERAESASQYVWDEVALSWKEVPYA